MRRDTPDSVTGGAGWPRRLVFWASAATAIFLCFWYQFDIILLTFAGALLAIILHACADWLDHHTPELSATGSPMRSSFWASFF